MMTLAGPATSVLEVRHSRFVAHAADVDSPERALERIAAWSVPDASHNCWAYRVGTSYRFNDDGEPAGTAGRPILAAIDNQQLDRVAVLVIRWYGGIKLGAGGLARAYGGCASQCLRGAAQRELPDLVDLRLRYGFQDTGSVHAALGCFEGERIAEAFDGDGVELSLRLPRARVADLKLRLRDATRDRIRFPDA